MAAAAEELTMGAGELTRRLVDEEVLTAALERITALEARDRDHALSLDTAWVVSCGTLVVLMQLGFALLESGMVREHNVLATLMKNMLDFVLGIAIAFLWGYQVAFGVSPLTLGIDDNGFHHQSFFFHQAFQGTAVTIVSGAIAERTTMWGYAALSLVVSGAIYSVAVRWTWGGGWLNDLEPPFHDFAGGGIVHGLGGCVALTACICIGAREGRWNMARAAEFVPHNIPSVIMGTMLLWVGWYGFNPGSTAALSSNPDVRLASNAALVTTVSAAFSGIGALAYSMGVNRRVELPAFCNGLLGGLAAITAGCDAIDPAWSPLVGLVASLICLSASNLLLKLKVDDVVDSFAVHGACGSWGVLAVGLFHRDKGLIAGGAWDAGLLRSQCYGMMTIMAISVLPIALLTPLMIRSGILRASPDKQRSGLDADFNLAAYVRRAELMQRLQGTSELLEQHGHNPIELLQAMTTLRNIIYRPLTPQAADNKLEGEILDVLEHLNTPKNSQHVGFISHHKADAGDAARIFVDQSRRLLRGKGDLEHSPRTIYSTDVPTMPEFRSIGSAETIGTADIATPASPMRTVSNNNAPEEGFAVDKLHSIKASANTIPTQDLFFLDSSNLKDLSGLLQHVETSANFILLLSRHTLKRPWCCAELCRAFACRINIIVVLVEWTRGDSRACHFPMDLENEIWTWTDFISTTERSASLKRMMIKLSPSKSYFNNLGSLRSASVRSWHTTNYGRRPSNAASQAASEAYEVRDEESPELEAPRHGVQMSVGRVLTQPSGKKLVQI